MLNMLLTPPQHNPAFPKWRTKFLLTTQRNTAAPNTKYATNNPTTKTIHNSGNNQQWQLNCHQRKYSSAFFLMASRIICCLMILCIPRENNSLFCVLTPFVRASIKLAPHQKQHTAILYPMQRLAMVSRNFMPLLIGSVK
jgi:hypothetical protein